MGPPLFGFVLVPMVPKLRAKYEPIRVYKGLHGRHYPHMQVVPDLVDELEAVGVIVNRRKSSVLPPPGHELTPTKRTLLNDASLPIVEEGIKQGGRGPDWNGPLRRGVRHGKDNRRGNGQACLYAGAYYAGQAGGPPSSHSSRDRSGYIERGIGHKQARQKALVNGWI